MELKYILISLISICFALAAFADDNQITILQEGDNFDLDITQIGFNNIVKQWTASEGIDGVDNTVIIKQARDRGNGTQPNTIELRRLWGDGNTLKLAQGYQIGTNGNFSIDNSEYGNTFAHINITGDNNEVLMTQRTNSNSSGHEYWLHLEGDYNDIYTVQREGGSQYINLDIYNDYNEVDLRQTNNGDHYMSVILRGTEPTDISVYQNGWNNKSYSITNYCYTSGGCNISVTQGN
jgi:hypothetical protein|tara:strand:- start:558 stop:1265 length:708 start_codon:yes stop_codon:yes gene_type:complete